MSNYPNRSPRAMTAIAALLALSTTPAFAQEALPGGMPPEPAPSIQSTPAPTLQSERPVVSEPVVQAVPTTTAEPVTEPSTAAKPATPVRSSARPAPKPMALPAPTLAAPLAAPALPTAAEPVAVTIPPAAELAPAIQANEVATTTQPAADDSLLALGGLLAALGLGGVFALARRRKPTEPEVVFERPIVAAPSPVGAAPRPAFDPAMFLPRADPVRSPAAIAPSGDRQAVLAAMVAAAPDEANPFTSPKARRKRARLILQARETTITKTGRHIDVDREGRTPTETEPRAKPALVPA